MAEFQEIIEEQMLIGEPSTFAIGYAFIGNDRNTEISMFVDGTNLLGFTKEGCHYTTRWMYLEGLVAWLKSFVMTMRTDPYPIDVEGEYAVERHSQAYDLAPEDEDAYWEYVFPLHDWGYNHSWHSESGGAILANIMFEYVADMVELSWDNRHPEEGVVFDCEFGGTRVDAETFKAVVLEFVDAYERHWGIKVDDESTWLRKS